MRLWHQALISLLPRQQLLGQHRECCALRGKGWTKKHSTVQYALNDKFEKLVAYHFLVINEMDKQGFSIDDRWKSADYRGKLLGYSFYYVNLDEINKNTSKIYEHHDESYLQECLENLANKSVFINI